MVTLPNSPLWELCDEAVAFRLSGCLAQVRWWRPAPGTLTRSRFAVRRL